MGARCRVAAERDAAKAHITRAPGGGWVSHRGHGLHAPEDSARVRRARCARQSDPRRSYDAPTALPAAAAAALTRRRDGQQHTARARARARVLQLLEALVGLAHPNEDEELLLDRELAALARELGAVGFRPLPS